MKQRICLECESPLQGRVDKKYCSDYCRNAFNNRRHQQSKKLIRNTHNRLRKNYRILEALNSSGKTTVDRKFLLNEGFDFSLCTSIDTTQKGSIYYYMYNQGYIALDNNKYLLIRKD